MKHKVATIISLSKGGDQILSGDPWQDECPVSWADRRQGFMNFQRFNRFWWGPGTREFFKNWMNF